MDAQAAIAIGMTLIFMTVSAPDVKDVLSAAETKMSNSLADLEKTSRHLNREREANWHIQGGKAILTFLGTIEE